MRCGAVCVELCFFFQAEDGIRAYDVTGVQTCALPIFTLGNLIALASIPHALALYFYRLLPCMFGFPWHGGSYKLTNRRVIELCNEVNFGIGPRWVRIAAGVKLIVMGVVAFCLLQYFLISPSESFFAWVWPGYSILNWTLTVICLLMVVGGILPLLAEVIGEPVPMPCFRVHATGKSIDQIRTASCRERVEI